MNRCERYALTSGSLSQTRAGRVGGLGERRRAQDHINLAASRPYRNGAISMSAFSPLPRPDFTCYYRYDELVEHLRSLVEARPHLAAMESIGKSYAGRDLWLVTLTNTAIGPAQEKPGYWIDGNTHAGEVAGSTACLYTIWRYLNDYGSDPRVTDLLDHQTTYILPRLCPDGAELYLTTPALLRSSVRHYPYDEEP